jgi:hypothetical protein
MKTSFSSRIVISCNYNGWADVPEEEREGMDTFEATRMLLTPVPAVRLLLPRAIPVRKAA